jgi:hypothetical protein
MHDNNQTFVLHILYTLSDLELHTMTLSGLCLEGISLLSGVMYDNHLFKNYLENVVVIVHYLIDLNLSK